ncbi:MAG: universal stress protein [Chloroflexota bacterium]|nr:universal stress protein [Chloroflexota bacterium]
MFKRILVPLDGSTRAERAIPAAARIARATGGTIVLLRVVNPPVDYTVSLVQPALLTEPGMEAEIAEANRYLADLVETVLPKTIDIKTEVISGAVTPTILGTIEEQQIDLMVICSHANTGIKRWILGSVAQKVARHGPVPVLVLREDGTVPTAGASPDTTHPFRILVGLDGSALAEAALEPAAQLAAAFAAPAEGALHLVRVLHLSPVKAGEHTHDSEVTRQGQMDAKAYLDAIEQRLHEGMLAGLHLQVTSSTVLDADIAGTIIKVAETGESTEGTGLFVGCDMIAMATHGRSGLQRWTLGSITEHVLGTTRLPMLIVHPQTTTTRDEERAGGEAVESERAAWTSLF